MSRVREIVKILETNAGDGRRRVSEVFEHFIEVTALTIRNSVDKFEWDEREQRYLELVGVYSRDDLDRFAKAMALLSIELGDNPRDVLGELYMSLEAGNDRLGQYFTPYGVCQLMAGMQVQGVAEVLETRPWASVYEPACGAGAMLVAMADALREKGFDPRQSLHVTAEDISASAVHMTYIQLSMLGIPAVVQQVNTLTRDEFSDPWTTPAHVVGGWGQRLSADRESVTRGAEEAQ